MKIIGCDFHPSFQRIAICDLETGELQERKLSSRGWPGRTVLPGVGLSRRSTGTEASGNSQWFLDLVERLGHEIWVGDAAKIRASYVRKQKTDKRDAGHILKLLLEKRFPQLWRPSAAMRDQRQLLRPPGQAGRDPNEGEEQLATPGDESGDAEEESAMDAPGMGAVPTVGDAGLGGEAAGRFVRVAQGVERARSSHWIRR